MQEQAIEQLTTIQAVTHVDYTLNGQTPEDIERALLAFGETIINRGPIDGHGGEEVYDYTVDVRMLRNDYHSTQAQVDVSVAYELGEQDSELVGTLKASIEKFAFQLVDEGMLSTGGHEVVEDYRIKVDATCVDHEAQNAYPRPAG